MPQTPAPRAAWRRLLLCALTGAPVVSALAARPAMAATANVSVTNLAFNPPSVSVAMTGGEPGAEAPHGHVVWTMADPGQEHTVTFDDPRLVSSGRLANGQRHEAIVYTPGTYSYRCTIHPGMTGTFVVTPAAPSTSSAAPQLPRSAAPSEPPGGGSGSAAAPVLIGVAVLAAAAGLAWLLLRRRRPVPDAGPSD